MIADRLLSKLESVKSTGPDRWLACCPAHEDKHPSLSIREAEDRILIHCWSGCGVHEIVSSAGLELSDLFPERIPIEGNRKITRPFPAVDILKALSSDCIFMIICAGDLAKGEALEQSDKDRLVMIASRFQQALQSGGIRA